MKGTAAHVCLASFRWTGRDTDVSSPLSMALCHICKPCFFFRSISEGLLGCRWFSGLTWVLDAGAGPGRPRDRKAGKDSREPREGTLLGVSPRLKSPDWVRVRGSSCKTLTIPLMGSSGPPPDDSNSTLDPFTMLSKALRGTVKATAVKADRSTRLKGKVII